MLFRHITHLLSLACLLVGVTTAGPIKKRDADFESVRTKLDKDHSGKGGDPRSKYFHESIFHPHYDGRFAGRELTYDEKRESLPDLVRTYLATMGNIGAETWLMHGSLLGWWWNRKIMPWDSDIDVQVSESTIHFLAEYYNMTVFRYKTPSVPTGKEYMLEVNPRYTIVDIRDKLNVIDARWTDMDNGLFIDITAVRPNETARAEGNAGALMCKDRHHYQEEDIFPLRDSYFEGMPVKIPYSYAAILEEEYGKKSLIKTVFQGHRFNQEKKEWEPVRQGFRQHA
ncbi:hypothetical protein L228DRAFT_96225 [Xylona heveae TC161]|uniref:LicD/FKTN/FKRP nucleotidyltransferase domain-containing protein n=1 Tax=Xylona heveae (strain CBS 132557 / TC161) TaxID=1328760 RepID=A0A165I5S6_XYLHT|nr:hypothetical protein L228DRAFT_96225 [Xylona heveae TC161]KZF24425.1 hypothetical protein L228DRAFT_96225 [Xylona heveae TC161]